METIRIATILCFGLSVCLATSYNHNHAALLHLNAPKLHLESQGLYDRYIGHHQGGYASPLLDVEPIILQNDRPLFIRKTIHGIPASAAATKPIFVGNGYGKEDLDLPGPVQSVKVFDHATAHKEKSPIVRKQVVLNKDLIPNQDHLENLHYGNGQSLGKLRHVQELANKHINYHQSAPVHLSQGLHEKTLVYFNEPLHGAGHILGGGAAYNLPYAYNEPKAHLDHGLFGYGGHIYGGNGHIYGGHGHIHGGNGHIYGGNGHIYGDNGHIYGGNYKY